MDYFKRFERYSLGIHHHIFLEHQERWIHYTLARVISLESPKLLHSDNSIFNVYMQEYYKYALENY